MRKHKMIAAALGAACLLAGCGTTWTMRVDKTGEETVVDPQTGGFIRTTHWEYADGYKTTTVTKIPPGSNLDTRAEPPRRGIVIDL